MFRKHGSAPTNELGSYSYYCRACGNVMKSMDFPAQCDHCGMMLPSEGWGISGDKSRSDSSAWTTYGYAVYDYDQRY